MKFWFTLALAISFLGIAVFGVFAMSHGEHSGCVAATANGAPCPIENNALVSALFHLNAFKNFSTAALVDVTAYLLLIAFALLCGLYANFGFQRNILLKRAYALRSFDAQPYAEGDSLLHWLALHENSPSVA